MTVFNVFYDVYILVAAIIRHRKLRLKCRELPGFCATCKKIGKLIFQWKKGQIKCLWRLKTFTKKKEYRGSSKFSTAWKVPVLGVILVYIFPHSDWMRRDTEYLSVFTPDAGKYGLEKHRIRTLLRSVNC